MNKSQLIASVAADLGESKAAAARAAGPSPDGEVAERSRAVRVTPPNGRSYFLIDTTGTGGWMRRDSLDEGIAFPMFPILEFD
jgi:hypothetical protein